MVNEQLALRVKAGIDPADNMLALYQQNTGLIKKFANKYRGLAEYDDLIQEGYIGLCNAVNNYNPDKASFSTYAVFWIRQAMIRYIDNSGAVRLPVHMCQRIREYYTTHDVLCQEYGRKPSDEEIRRTMGLTHKEYATLKTGLQMSDLESLDKPVLSDEDRELTILDTIPGGQDPAEVSTDKRQQEEFKSLIWGMVDSLPEDKGCMIRQRYKAGMQIQEIADKNNISYWQADNRIRSGIRELGRQRSKIMSYLPDKLETLAYYGSAKLFSQTWTSSTERVALKLT